MLPDEAAARVQAGRLPDRTGVGIPDRSDIRTVRSARFPIRANGKPPAGCIPATRRKTRENGKKRDEFPGYCIRPETYRAPGDRIENAAGERDRSVRESGSALRNPRARKARATGLRAVRVGLSRQKCRAYLPNTFLH